MTAQICVSALLPGSRFVFDAAFTIEVTAEGQRITDVEITEHLGGVGVPEEAMKDLAGKLRDWADLWLDRCPEWKKQIEQRKEAA